MPIERQSRYILLPSKPPDLVEDGQTIYKDIAAAVVRDVRNVQRAIYGMHGISRHDTIYTGVSGIAFMEYHLAGIGVPTDDRSFTPQSLIAAADNHLGLVLKHQLKFSYSSDRLSFVETSIGIVSLVLTRGLWTSENVLSSIWKTSKDFLNDARVHKALAEDARKDLYSPSNKEDGCEVLYGRAGLLYALLYIRKSFQGKPRQEQALVEDITSDQILASLVDSIMTRGKHGGFLLSSEFRTGDFAHLPPLMWTWHGKRYLGAAHGMAGILHMLLSCPETVIRPHLPDIFGTISWLIEIQGEDGNWPTKAPTQRGFAADSTLIQWCHGAPGMIVLLSASLRVLRDRKDEIIVEEGFIDKIRGSIEVAANLVYKRGLLCKGVGLCHGVAGSVYALLAASNEMDTSSNGRYFLSRAAHLALLSTFWEEMTSAREMITPDHPWSLYEGLAGMCCALAEVLSRLDKKSCRGLSSGFPGFDDL